MAVMRRAIILLTASLVLISCSPKATTKVDNPGVIYVKGMDYMNKKKYKDAAEEFIKVRENYPFDPIAIVAAVKLGDAYFAEKEYLLAAGVYEDFFGSHPEDENVPYVLSRLGECYEKLSDSIDRDQTNALKGIERLTYLKNRYPQSPYAKDAEAGIKKLIADLAARELYVGEFYYRTGYYNAATMRLEYFLNKYPGAKDTDKALFYLIASYGILKDPEKVQFYSDKLFNEYPKSILTRTAQRERTSLQSKADKKPGSVQAASSTKPASGPATAAEPALLSYATTDRKKKEIELFPPTAAQTAAPQPAPVAAEEKAEKIEKTGATEKVAPTDTAGTTEKAPDAVTSEDLMPAESVVTPREESAPGKSPTMVASATAGESTKAVPQETAQAGASPAPVTPGGIKPEAAKAKGPEDSATPASAPKTPKGEGKKEGPFGFFDKKEPVDVVADVMEGQEQGKVIVFKGNVIAKQGDLSIFCETLTAYLDEESNEIEKAHATGNVKIVKLDRIATSKDAYFDNTKGEITLKGNVVAFAGPDKVSGETVIYYINEDRLQVLGEKDKRARAILNPKKDPSKN